MNMRKCFELPNGNFQISLEQRGRNGRFRVTYGSEVHDKLTYEEAARELGLSIMHSLAIDGKLGNEGP